MRKHLLNVLGLIIGFTIGIAGPVFCIWQFDLICSGPVWWGDATHGWSVPSRYADQYFQCFFWKTTVGSAYDNLLFFAVLSAIIGMAVIFASLWTWND